MQLIITPAFLAQQVANVIPQQVPMPLQFAFDVAPLPCREAAAKTIDGLMAIDFARAHQIANFAFNHIQGVLN
jgi:hypothetical protein